MNLSRFTFQEAYGHMPTALWTLIKRHNVTPSDYMMMQLHMCEDWERISDFILAHVRGNSFSYPFGG